MTDAPPLYIIPADMLLLCIRMVDLYVPFARGPEITTYLVTN